IYLHGFDPHLQKDNVFRVRHSLYSWAVFSIRNPIVRVYRMCMLILGVIGFPLIPKDLSDILDDYKGADLIVLEPGGYLTSRKGLTQSLNFFMQIVPIWYAIRLRKRIIQSPCTIGSFAYRWQESLVCYLLKKVDRIFTREDISWEFLKKNGISAEKSVDLIFFSPVQKKTKKYLNKKHQKTIGIVMRQLWQDDNQKRLEERIANALIRFAQEYNYSIVPIVHSDAEEYGDFDKQSVLRVFESIKNAGISVQNVKIIHTVQDAKNTYGRLSLLLTLRLHAGLISLIEGVPAVFISDEIKSRGILGMLDMENLLLCLHDAYIYEILSFIVKNKKDIQKNILSKVRQSRSYSRGFIEELKSILLEN
ncbi:MAG: polysaccharide pyruvyl transferase family protein, partial [Patescibacteria group bacterium]|nr:polysaccharide pyruvyl transferase family protein [Patescibacteria group bacterium]